MQAVPEVAAVAPEFAAAVTDLAAGWDRWAAARVAPELLAALGIRVVLGIQVVPAERAVGRFAMDPEIAAAVVVGPEAARTRWNPDHPAGRPGELWE